MIDSDQEVIFKEAIHIQSLRIIQFLRVMKFDIAEDVVEDFRELLSNYDKETIQEKQREQKKEY